MHLSKSRTIPTRSCIAESTAADNCRQFRFLAQFFTNTSIHTGQSGIMSKSLHRHFYTEKSRVEKGRYWPLICYPLLRHRLAQAQLYTSIPVCILRTGETTPHLLGHVKDPHSFYPQRWWRRGGSLSRGGDGSAGPSLSSKALQVQRIRMSIERGSLLKL